MTHTKTLVLVITACAVAGGSVQAATILTDDFQFGVGNPANVNGSISGWTKIGTNLFGGIGTENQILYPTSSEWAYFQTNGSNWAGIYRSTGTAGNTGDTITISFDLGGRSGADNYTGIFSVSLWNGDPGAGGSQLASLAAANPVEGAINSITLAHTLTSDASDLVVRFEAGTAGSGFEQAIIDNVVVDLQSVPEPSSATLGCIGMLALLRRKR